VKNINKKLPGGKLNSLELDQKAKNIYLGTTKIKN
jgi:hypothetical protein